MPEEEKSRRLLQGQVVIYPFTKQQNVIGLQKTITDKLPIVSPEQPQDNFVDKQAWFEVSDDDNEDVEENYGSQQSFASPSREIVEYNYESIPENENYGNDEDVIEENYEGAN